MIKIVRGKVVDKEIDSVIVDTGNIGYKIFVSLKNIGEITLNSDKTFYTYMSVKENSMDLYGFLEKKELDFFELLLGLNGVGPKSAISILSASDSETIISGIQSGDYNYLSKITGIGKKTAEKILMGLKDKIGVIENQNQTTHGSTAIDALAALGYSERDARQAILLVKNKESTEAMIKEALQLLNNK